MKYTIFFVLLLSILGCKKSSNHNSPSGAAVSATVNGAAWSATLQSWATYYTANAQFQIWGSELAGAYTLKFGLLIITPIMLNKPIGPDTPINNFGYFNDVVYVDEKTINSYKSYDGQPDFGGHSTLTVTAYDSAGHTISGTFSGVLYNQANSNDSVLVTNGRFNTSFTVQ
jgi:hypothetical protein